MSDHSLTTKDVTVLRDILQLSYPTRPEDQAARTFDVLELIDGLLGSDFVSFQVMDSRHRVRPYLQHLEEGERLTMTAEEIAASDEPFSSGLELFWHDWWTSPCSLPERTGRPVVVSLQSFYGQRAWLTSRLHAAYLTFADELLLAYPIGPGLSVRILVGRVDNPWSPFGHRELTLMHLLEPHLERLLVRTAPTYEPPGQAGLTARQVEILRLVEQGLTNREIGRSLGLREGTVRKHLENTFARLGVLSRTAAVTSVFGFDQNKAEWS